MEAERYYEVLKEAIDEADELPPCQVTDPEIWFAEIEDGYNYARTAKKFCNSCPVMTQCAQYAIASNEPHGIWGGLTPRERQKLRANGIVRGRGRPRAT